MSETLKQNIAYRYGRITESLNRLIPIGASSFEDFSAKVALHECSIAEARLEIYNECEEVGRDGLGLSSICILGTGYEIDYRALSSKRRRIKYKRSYGYIPNGKIKSKQQFDGILLMGLVTANNNLRAIQGDFPGVETKLSQTIKGDNRVISEESRAILDEIKVPETSFFRNKEGSARFVLKPEEIPNIHILLSEYGDPSDIPAEYFMDKSVSLIQVVKDIKVEIRNSLRKLILKKDKEIL